MKILQQDDVVKFLQEIFPLLLPHYETYCDRFSFMSFEKFIE